jgi:hypothetical protein
MVLKLSTTSSTRKFWINAIAKAGIKVDQAKVDEQLQKPRNSVRICLVVLDAALRATRVNQARFGQTDLNSAVS